MAFVEAVGVAEAAIAQASIAGSQGDPSNPQRFRTHHPPTFTGGGDSMVDDLRGAVVREVSPRD